MEQDAVTLYNVFSGEVTKKKKKGQTSPIKFVCCVK